MSSGQSLLHIVMGLRTFGTGVFGVQCAFCITENDQHKTVFIKKRNIRGNLGVLKALSNNALLFRE